MIPEVAVQAAADAIEARMFGAIKLGELARAALEAAAPHIYAAALREAASALTDVPGDHLECGARIEESKVRLNVEHGIQASVRWLQGRADLMVGTQP